MRLLFDIFLIKSMRQCLLLGKKPSIDCSCTSLLKQKFCPRIIDTMSQFKLMICVSSQISRPMRHINKCVNGNYRNDEAE